MLPAGGRGDWAVLLEQAGDFNDELNRENCELHRELQILRQRRQRQQGQREGADGASIAAQSASRAAALLPRVLANLRSLGSVDAASPPAPHGVEGLTEAVESAVRHVFAEVIDNARNEAALTSSEETAALVNEKVALKEFSLRQQERILELEMARARLSGGGAQEHWTSRFTSALPGALADVSAALSALDQRHHMAPAPSDASRRPASSSRPPSPSAAAAEPEHAHVPLGMAVGDECEVVGKRGAILRASDALDSDQVATLPQGSRVRILEHGPLGSRRAKVEALWAPPMATTEEAQAPAPKPAETFEAPMQAPAESTGGTDDAAPPAGDCVGGGSGDGAEGVGSATVGGSDGEAQADESTGGTDNPAPEGRIGDGGGNGGDVGPQDQERVALCEHGKVDCGDVVAAPTPLADNDTETSAGAGTDAPATDAEALESAPAAEAVRNDTAAPAEPSVDQADVASRLTAVEAALPAQGQDEKVVGAIGWLSVSTKDGKALVRPAPVVVPPVEPLPVALAAALAPAVDAPPQLEVAGSPQERRNTAAQEPTPMPKDKPVFLPDGSVVVSTTAWLSLRKERTQREKQIKALQAQVDNAAKELTHLAEVRAQLREQRGLLLESRRRGNELQEIA